MKWKFIGLSAVALMAFGGIASAAGVFKHKDPARDVVAQRVQVLEQAMRAQDAPSISAARRGLRGPKGPKGQRGSQGPKGATGAAGPAGPKGTFGSVVSYSSAPITLCGFESGACAVGSVEVECPPGTLLVGGGYTGAGILTTVAWNSSIGNSWAIIAVNLDEVPVTNLKATAQCAGS